MYNTHPLAQTPFNLNIPYVRIFIFPNYHPIIIRFKHCAIQTIICFLMELTKVYCNNYSRKPTNFGSDSEILVIFPSRSPKRSSHLGRYKLLLFEHIIFFLLFQHTLNLLISSDTCVNLPFECKVVDLHFVLGQLWDQLVHQSPLERSPYLSG